MKNIIIIIIFPCMVQTLFFYFFFLGGFGAGMRMAQQMATKGRGGE